MIELSNQRTENIMHKLNEHRRNTFLNIYIYRAIGKQLADRLLDVTYSILVGELK